MCFCCPQEEDEVPDDETVNQMIARSEEEFELFMVSNNVYPSDLTFVFLFLHLCCAPHPSAWTWIGAARKLATPDVSRV